MAKHDDVAGVGRSTLVPYIEGEDPKHRHARRKKAAMSAADELRRWCKAGGHGMRLLNQNSLIEIKVKGNLYEWWPGTAKLIVNKKWDRGLHCHDYQQLIQVMERKVR